MRILYISRLAGYDWQGPSHSVPMQIGHQSKTDEVLWLNLGRSAKEEWKSLPYYLESDKKLKTVLQDVPAPFENPDLVVFEGVYEYPFAKIVFDIWRRNIPYVLVPRSALTEKAQKKRAWKKVLGNLAFFNAFVKKAAAIHYLTDAEQKDSCKWKKDSFVVPNGMLAQEKRKASFFEKGKTVITYVGRMEKYQKGLDILVSACGEIAAELRQAQAEIHLYGPDREGSVSEIAAEIEKHGLDDLLFLHDGVFGEEKERVLLESDAFLMTSRFEGLPMGLIEALAYGLPAMVTEGTNMTNVVEDFGAGWTADNSVEGVVSLLRRAIAERGKYQEKSANAHALSKQYNWESIAEKTHAEYEKLTEK